MCSLFSKQGLEIAIMRCQNPRERIKINEVNKERDDPKHGAQEAKVKLMDSL